MDTKIFLQAFNSKKSTNTSNGVNVEFRGNRKLLPLNDVAEVISQYDQYTEERESCNKIRLTFQVNTTCSNVLFNRISEVVKDEGSDTVSFLNYQVNGKSDSEIFKGVIYKKKTMDFWSSNIMNYIKADSINSEDSKKTIDSVLGSKGRSYNTLSTTNSISINHITNAIRDTQLSNEKCDFVYHCGLDIFNNHLIRSKTFKTVCKLPNTNIPTSDGYDAFNTIGDLMRDVTGNKVIEKIYFPDSAFVPNNAKIVSLHLYEYNDIYSFEESVKNNLIVKYNGWVGFNNNAKIKSYDNFSTSDEMPIERPIMYVNGGDFVDMYPSRDLYSFIPKYNNHRHRVEKNWNYCITYPSSSTTEGFEDIINKDTNSLKTVYFDENTRADNGVKQLVMYSIAKHGLSVGDYVNIYKTKKDGTSEVIIEAAEVNDVVDPYIFTVLNSSVKVSDLWVSYTSEDFKSGKKIVIDDEHEYILDPKTASLMRNGKHYYIVNQSYVNLDDDAQNISYKKLVNGIECDYYVRIFSKVPNFKYASGDTSNDYEIYKDNEKLIHEYQAHEYEFESHTSRLSFAKNIYGDNLAEIVFTDDIDISNLHDNLGRPLTQLYLTIIKNNKGYKEWYGYNYASTWEATEIASSTVEYSHAFGAITCGIETSEESRYVENLNSVFKLENVSNGDRYMGYDMSLIGNDRESYITSDSGANIMVDPNEIWYERDKHFYGDLCCYDNYYAIESHIDYIMHRFNTAQRESYNSASASYYSEFGYDEITRDDYDSNDQYNIETRVSDFECNKKLEGYYYIPHYEIPIKTFDKLQSMMPEFLSIRSISVKGTGIYQITTLQQHFLGKGDKAVLFDYINNKYYNLVTIGNDGDTYRIFTCNVYDEKTGELTDLPSDIQSVTTLNSYDRLRNVRLFKMDNLGAPSYCRVLKDGTCRVIWRDVLNNGFNRTDKSVEEYPFTNGAFYINKKIDLYLRRQDPYNIFALYSEGDTYIEGEYTDMSKEDNYVKEDEIVC